MTCWKCGKEVNEGQLFCAHCGADLRQGAEQQQAAQDTEQQQAAQNAEQQQATQNAEQQQAARNTGAAAIGDLLKGGNASMPLKIFAIVCAVVYGIKAISYLFTVVRQLFQVLGGYGFMMKYCIANIPMLILSVFVCLVLLAAAFFRSDKNADGLFILFAAGMTVRMLYAIFLQIIFRHGYSNMGTQILLLLMSTVIVIGGWFLLTVLMGETPLAGKNKDALVESLKDVAATLRDASEAASQKVSEANAARAAQNAQNAQNNAAFNAQYNTQANAAFNAQNNAQANAAFNAQNNAQANAPVTAVSVNNAYRQYLKTDRSLVVYILLGVVTCGIYNLWFIHSLAKDVNIACAGDGKKTSGLLAFILLSFVTCGIYGFYWYYSLGNRLAFNAVKYNMHFQENGTSVLMWQLFGALLCGIGPFIAMNIIIKNSNSLFAAYNNSNF